MTTLPEHLSSSSAVSTEAASAAAVGGGNRPSPTYAIVGNPNCGKSTLFNALTGLRQKIGNYPGVTVEKKVGTAWSQHGQPITLIDLPGSYSLAARSPDEAVTRDVLFGRRAETAAPDRILCIVDATNLERNLYLVHQVLDLGRPVILVLNMMDVARASGLAIDASHLEHELGIPVIPCEAVNGKGIVELRMAMSRASLPLPRHAWDVPAEIAPAVAELQAALMEGEGKPALLARAEALLLLTAAGSAAAAREASDVATFAPESRAATVLSHWQSHWRKEGVDWAASLVAARYDAISALCERVVAQRKPVSAADSASAAAHASRSDRIDAVVTHPLWGWLVLGGLMTLIFFSIFTFAEYPMDWIDGSVASFADWVKEALPEGDLRDLITDGAIAGVGGVVVFLPQILILFFFIGLLESTGYMAREAFIMDRLMSRVGLNGKSFIPMLSSYACAIPGIMAARTIENHKDRLVTILVAPLMSCSARLPVYLLMIAALLPGDTVPVASKVGLMLLMYALGTGGAFGFAWLFKKTLLKGEPPLMIMELPPYRMPALRAVARQMLDRAGLFLKRAGTIILSISIVLWFLATYPRAPEGADESGQLAQSFAGQAGHLIEPAIEPLGFDWQVGIGLITSFAAREVFVSTMGVVFNVDDPEEDTTPLREALAAATWPDGRPLFTPLVCLNLMIFYVFAMQCVATVAVVRRETNSWRWPLFQIGYMTGTAWLACFVVYQVGTALGF
ncbi:ferrous iron transporter B [Cephaloticoccus capnophilus]|uniref:Ferrous iron transport protein B n=1 Tax=Cephaloticoccus capnophilus TaxID=1548208 RepID=A0A139SNM6_9BACT|nr:ferrous iron transport protein B [Cephaloticoccus capnophilus]KXU36185.1 ferrous iron transporter B [Cephaloticoccus capnophilus]